VSGLLVAIHVLVCIVLIIAVLLQSGKAADLAGAFGGVGSQTAFGPRGAATLLGKITTIGAIVFMLTSMGLWILSAKGDRSVVSGEKETPAAVETKKDAQTPPGADKPAATPATQTPQPQPPDTKKEQPETKKEEPPKKDTSPDIKE
jgi:preprotein translocase subunit SecG